MYGAILVAPEVRMLKCQAINEAAVGLPLSSYNLTSGVYPSLPLSSYNLTSGVYPSLPLSSYNLTSGVYSDTGH